MRRIPARLFLEDIAIEIFSISFRRLDLNHLFFSLINTNQKKTKKKGLASRRRRRRRRPLVRKRKRPARRLPRRRPRGVFVVGVGRGLRRRQEGDRRHPRRRRVRRRELRARARPPRVAQR